MKKVIVIFLFLVVDLSVFAQLTKIIPYPNNVKETEGVFTINNQTSIQYDLFEVTANGSNNSSIEKSQVLKIMEHVADWQIANQGQVKYHDLDWTNATLYQGMMELTAITADAKYNQWLLDIGNKYKWQPFYSMYMADDIAVSQMYLDMYKKTGDKRMLDPTMARTEWVINHPSSSTLNIDYSNYLTLERWSWCDALFMAPPVYAQMYRITKEAKYLDFMNKEYKVTYNLLYDMEEKLFFRDCSYFKKKETNGQKIFWGRGNGWVMGGLVKILKELPESIES